MVGQLDPTRRSGLARFAVAGLALAVQAAPARATCRFLMPIGGGAKPVVTKRISPDGLLRRNNWSTDLRVVDANPRLTPGQRLVFGPFASVPGKRTTIVNVRVGATTMPMSTGFSYRVSVEGCS